MKINNPKTTLIGVFALLAFNADAQIQMAQKPYQSANEPEIGFSFDTPAPPPVIQTPVVPLEVWAVKRSSYLHETMRQWSTRAGWTLVWGIGENEDLRMEAANEFRGDFKTVVTDLFNSFPPTVRINAELRPDNKPPLIFINRDDGAR